MTRGPIRRRLAVKATSGISANGMPKERKTWLRTSACVASTPRPTTMIEAMARKVALDALDGRAAAQKFVLEILEGADCGAAARTRTWARPRREGPCSSKRPEERGGESNEEDDEEVGRSDRTNFPGAGKKAGKI